eukprot:7580491-Pyramimonas_sp.AAC.1
MGKNLINPTEQRQRKLFSVPRNALLLSWLAREPFPKHLYLLDELDTCDGELVPKLETRVAD